MTTEPPTTSRGTRRPLLPLLAAWAVLVGGIPQAGAVGVDFVYIGDPGNTADTTGYGAVGYTYEIGKFEFTYGQYTRFLNAVDPDGTNQAALYNNSGGAPFNNAMGNVAWGGITFTGANAPGTKYTTQPNKDDKPVTSVSWFNAARVANWLQKGAQTYATSTLGTAAINDGAYTLAGATSGSTPARNADATVWIPSEDEWYKAAYSKGGGTNAGYWVYASQSNGLTPVFSTSDGIGTRNGMTPVTAVGYANYGYGARWNVQPDNYNATYVLSVGTSGAPSAYGTVDQSGNAAEWTSVGFAATGTQATWGGSYATGDYTQSGNSRQNGTPGGNSTSLGFRLASALPTALAWNTASGTWSASTIAWVSPSTAGYAFAPGASATFSGVSGGTITVSGSMQPSAVAVSTSSGTYTFATSAGNLITGTATLSKSGAGTLVLSGSNAYSGGTTLSAGTLRAGHDGALGSGAIVLAGGTLASADASPRSLANAVSITADTTFGDATGTGAITLSGAVNLGGATRTITTSSNVTLSGAVTNGGLTKSGAGTLTLAAADTFSGPTRVAAGTLALGHTQALAGSILDLATADTGSVTFSAGTGTYLFGGLQGTRGLDLGPNSIAVGAGGASTVYSGSITGSGSVVKQGAGTLTLSGSHGYTGPTTVQAGTLVVNGTLANSAVTVQSGATLSGNAFLGSSLTVLASGTLSPGTITAGALTLQDGSTTRMEIAGSATAGTDYDTLVVTGSNGLAYGGTLALSFSGTASYATGTTFDLFRFSGTSAGNFAAVTLSAAGGSPYANLSFSLAPDGSWYSGDTAAHQYLRFTPLTGDLVVVPEPSTWVTAIAGIAMAAGMVRRRHART